MFSLFRRSRLILAIGVLAALAVAGVAYAATQSGGSTSRQAFLNDVAKRLNVTPQQLSSALAGASSDRLAAAVAAGKLTQAQADAIKKRMQQGGGSQMGEGPGGWFGQRPGGGPGAGGFGPPGLGFGMFGADGGGLDAAASYLGLTSAKLQSDLQSGKSLAQIATAQGKTASGLESAMTTAVKTSLDKAVASKKITSAQEQQLLSRLSAMLSAIANRSGAGPMMPGPGFHGAFARPGGSWNHGGPGSPPMVP